MVVYIAGNFNIFFSPSSYDHLASVLKKVLEEKPDNISGKLLMINSILSSLN